MERGKPNIFSSQAQAWSMTIQLQLAKALHDKFGSDHKLSMLEAIKLAPTLLDVASTCRDKGVELLEALDQLLVGNLPKHVENMLAYLPRALEMLISDKTITVLTAATAPATYTNTDKVRAAFISQLFCPAERVADWATESELSEIVDEIRIEESTRSPAVEQRSVHTTYVSSTDPRRRQRGSSIMTSIGLEYCECRSTREEALVALLKAKDMWARSNCAESGRQAGVAIVSGDARFVQVAAALAPAIGVRLEVGHALPIIESEPFLFLRIVFQAAAENFSPVPLLTLLKHQRFAWKPNNQLAAEVGTKAKAQMPTQTQAQAGTQAQLVLDLETKYLRGVRRYEGLAELIGLVKELACETFASKDRENTSSKEPELQTFLAQLRDEFAELVELVGQDVEAFESLMDASTRLASKLSGGLVARASFLCQNSQGCLQLPPYWVASPPKGLPMTVLGTNASQKPTAPLIAGCGPTPSVIASPFGGEATQYGGKQTLKDTEPTINPRQFIEILQLLMARHTTATTKSEVSNDSDSRLSPTITILPPTDDRLLAYANVVITGLNEGASLDFAAQAAQNDSTQMLLGLIGVERETASAELACETFASKDKKNTSSKESQRASQLFELMHRPNVLLTRSATVNRMPQRPSRWLVRLKLLELALARRLLRADARSEERLVGGLKLSNTSLRDEAACLYVPDVSEIRKYEPPAPIPGVYRAKLQAEAASTTQEQTRAANPHLTKLSVTQVEKLMRNPYGIYAKMLLRLNPLDEIDKTPGQMEFGQCIHAVVQAYSDRYDSSLNDLKQRKIFDRLAMAIVERTVRNEMTRKLWLMRLDRVGDWLIKFETRRLHDNKKVFSETRGKLTIPLDDGVQFELRCIADRIEIDSAGRLTIIDFKTAGIPTSANVRSFAAPQLPLEALIAMNDGFDALNRATEDKEPCLPRKGGDDKGSWDDSTGDQLPSHSIAALTYIQLGSGAKFGIQTNVQADLPVLVAEARRGLTALLNFYNAPTATFRCSAEMPGGGLGYDDYAHLARVKELQ